MRYIFLFFYILFLLKTEIISISAKENRDRLDDFENSILQEMNLLRMEPQKYLHILEKKKENSAKSFSDEKLAAIKEVISILKTVPPVQELSSSKGLVLAARDHAEDLGETKKIGHLGSDHSNPFQRMNRYGKWKRIAGENIVFGKKNSMDLVIKLLIDEENPGRLRRRNLLNTDYHFCGIACHPYKTDTYICVITYAGGYISRE
ncbi:MAG: hypothetical protein KDK45_06855 [Leptospiraceae bacterium]|nr:hypothetical protein [Leptospiraceae bacterium]